MASKSREARNDQKIYWEKKLEERAAFLKEKGINQESVAKDSRIRRIRAKLRKTGHRLHVIEGNEKKNEDMARLKSEKVSQEKGKLLKNKKTEPEEVTVSKRQQKKQKKREQKSKDEN